MAPAAYSGGEAGADREMANGLLSECPEVRLSEKSPRILVVDDDDAIRAMVERVLRREKFEVESARDGFEAIEKLSRSDYSAVLLDLMMPRVDGHGVLQFLEKELRDRNMPHVIIMTANLGSLGEAPKSAPVFRVLPKPFDIRQLVSHIRECAAPPAPQTQAGPADVN